MRAAHGLFRLARGNGDAAAAAEFARVAQQACRASVDGGPELLLAHPGGPFWKHRDGGAWTMPKCLIEEGEELLAAARREFAFPVHYEAG